MKILLSNNLVLLLVAITFYLSNSEFNYTLFGVFGAFAKFKQIGELSTLTN